MLTFKIAVQSKRTVSKWERAKQNVWKMVVEHSNMNAVLSFWLHVNNNCFQGVECCISIKINLRRALLQSVPFAFWRAFPFVLLILTEWNRIKVQTTTTLHNTLYLRFINKHIIINKFRKLESTPLKWVESTGEKCTRTNDQVRDRER